jgi:hypothetical protein
MLATATLQRLGTVVAGLVLVTTVAACGSSASPSPGAPGGSPAAPSAPPASAQPSASGASSGAPTNSGSTGSGGSTTASPPAVDAAKAFLATMQRGDFQAEATITGQATVAATTLDISGSFTVRGADNHTVLKVATMTEETLTSNGTTYERRNGLWFVKPGTTGGSNGLASAFQRLLDVRDAGVVTRDGRPLHRIVSNGPPLPLSAMGMDGEGTLTIDFYVEDDGTLRVMAVHVDGTPAGSTTPMAMTIEFAFTKIGGPVVVGQPPAVWTTFTSKRYGYSVAYPADWDPKQSPKKSEPDAFYSADASGYFVYRYATEGNSLNALSSAYIRNTKRAGTKVAVTSNDPATVDGSKARRLEWNATFKGTRHWSLEAVVVRGKYVYFFQLDSLAPITNADRDGYESFLSTVDLPGAAPSAATSSPIG